MHHSLRTFIVDAFTDKPFRGNPAGICLVDSELPDDLMSRIAGELNATVTAFVLPLDAPGRFAIRYFSTKQEIPLCGHATFASARVAFDALGIAESQFRTHAGLDLATQATAEAVRMSLPAYSTRPAEAPPALLAALGLDTIRNAAYNEENRMLLVEIADSDALAALRPEFAALVKSHSGIVGVLVTARAKDGRYDFHSRYFWPWTGANEDPATGSTHSFLTGYWSERLGKKKLKSYQASERSGFMDVELCDGRVMIQSQAIIVLEGRLRV